MVKKQEIVRKVRTCPRLAGEIDLPGDKSISHRAIIFNSFARQGKTRISNFSPGQDCASTIRCLRTLGTKITRETAQESISLVISGNEANFQEASNVLNAGNSGTTMRLLSGLLASQPFLSVITGDASLRSRPMKRLVEPLRAMGADIQGRQENSFAPLAIRGGNLKGIEYALPIPSAQIKTAILLAGLFAHGETAVYEKIPSRDHTERMLKQMGIHLRQEDNWIYLNPPTSPPHPLPIHIPGDISSAAYFLVAGAIHPQSRITLRNCGINPTRTGILDVLTAMGAMIQIKNKRTEAGEPVADITIESSELKGIEIAGEIIPRLIDEIPVLAVAGCVAKGKTVIRNAGELRVKESDRITTVSRELSRMGARIEELPDGMIIYGGTSLYGAEVSSHFDHRLAMSLAIAGLIARGETIVNHAQATRISYPSFWDDLEKLTLDVN